MGKHTDHENISSARGVSLDKRVSAIELEQLRQQKDVTEITLAFHEAGNLLGTDLVLDTVIEDVGKTSFTDILDEETALALANMPPLETTRNTVPNINVAEALAEEMPTTKSQSTVVTGEYVIRFQFGVGAPISEWNEETLGWREAGQGTRFQDMEYPRLRIVQLKNKWPDYPIELYKLPD
ncbi:hypothetical protein BegalDRAFT_2639 [Beggiatoa alba B18LD]|uniref:Uncharacterized protein n=1 Tax=Beggiatoa alba B18LD TaxID=395493 RepID=I3CIN8_9GAMM|nr:hypothetical protein [Beggiatoa alba]EIJ43481.1 hypothetical protein BegalDRAFT_2639 [Beggiatoa alba B18LD]